MLHNLQEITLYGVAFAGAVALSDWWKQVFETVDHQRVFSHVIPEEQHALCVSSVRLIVLFIMVVGLATCFRRQLKSSNSAIVDAHGAPVEPKDTRQPQVLVNAPIISPHPAATTIANHDTTARQSSFFGYF